MSFIKLTRSTFWIWWAIFAPPILSQKVGTCRWWVVWFLSHSLSLHAEKTLEEYTDEIINEIIPALAQAIERKEVSPTLCDVFMETNVFGADETERYDCYHLMASFCSHSHSS